MVAIAGRPLLEVVSSQSREWLASIGHRKSYADGELIHSRGDSDVSMGIVVSGSVRIGRLQAGGTNSFVSEIRAGHHYGDVLLLGRERRTHDAIAIGPTAIDHYDARAFELMLGSIEIVRALYAVTGARLTGAMVMNDDLRSLAPELHLAKILLHQSRDPASCGAVPCLQEELATLLGVSIMTLSKALNRLKQEGLIQTGYRQIAIPDRSRLKDWLAQRLPA